MKRFIELFCQRYKLGFSILIIIILLMVSYLIYINSEESVKASDTSLNNVKEVVEKAEKDIKIPNKIKVDVKGLVANPGVYELDEGSRVIDAINISGGLLEDADVTPLNLSKKLKDENVIIVGKIKNMEPEKVIEYIYKECECPDYNSACIDKNDVINNSGKQKNGDSKTNISTESKIISINSATKEELQTLSGVGESKAISIIKYREENGEFKNIEEIKNVSGIGDALFEKIKDYITV